MMSWLFIDHDQRMGLVLGVRWKVVWVCMGVYGCACMGDGRGEGKKTDDGWFDWSALLCISQHCHHRLKAGG